MRPERATKYGLVAAGGIILISVIVYALIQETRGSLTDDSVIYLVLIVGTTVSLIFLFLVIGDYVDRELNAREATILSDEDAE